MHSILFHIGSFTVNSYGVCVALGLIAGITLLFFRAEKFGLDTDLVFNAGLIAFVAGILGAKLLYVIVEWKTFSANPKLLLQFGSGFVAYGGIIAGILTFIIYLRIKKVNALDYVELAVPALALGQCLGRIGCFLAGCCYGAPAPEHFFWTTTFPSFSDAPSGIALYPVQLWGSVLDLILCLILVWCNYKEKFCGFSIAMYLLLYSLGRFCIEFFRGDPRGVVGPLSTSQFIAIFTFMAGAAAFFIFKSYGMRPVRVGGNADEEDEEEEALSEEEEEPEEAPAEEAAAESAAETETAENDGFEKMIYDEDNGEQAE